MSQPTGQLTGGPEQRPGTFRLADGVTRVFAAELLLLPTGLVTSAVLTRALGPDGYGLFTLAASIAGWLTSTTTALLARATVKSVSEAADWAPMATSVLRWRLVIGALSTLILAASARSVAYILHAPDLALYLQVFAVDLLVYNLARAYREVLTGTGHFRQLAVVSGARWIARMVFLATLVGLTRSVMAAVIGSVGATLAELVVARHFQRISLRGRQGVGMREMWSMAAPLFVYGAATQLYTKVDLFALSALGGTTSQAGYYGAAQNLAVPPGLFSLAFAPLLLATLGRLRRDGRHDEARRIGRTALRLAMALLPFAALVAGASGEIVRVIFGPLFASAAPLLALLFGAAVALAVTAVAMAIVMAADRPHMVSLLGVGVLGAAIVGHLAFIPTFGALGAATVTAATGAGGAVVALWLVHRVWRVTAYGTLVRALLVAVLAGWAASAFVTSTVWGLAAKLVVLSFGVVGAFIVLGELTSDDLVRLRETLPHRRSVHAR